MSNQPVDLVRIASPEQLDNTIMHSNDPALAQILDMEKTISTILDDKQKAPLFDQIGQLYVRRYNQLSSLDALNMAIKCQNLAVALTPEQHFKAPFLANLALSHYCKFLWLKETIDADKSIKHFRHALSLILAHDPNKRVIAAYLARSYHARFQHLEDIPDIHAGIEFMSQAVSLASEPDAETAGYLDTLSGMFYDRFKQLGRIVDIDTAIEKLHQAISLIPESHGSMAAWLGSLGFLYRSRFEYFQMDSDVDIAVEHLHKAIALTRNGDARLTRLLDDLGSCYCLRYKKSGELSDSTQALELQNRATSLTPPESPDYLLRLGNLGIPYLYRFERTGMFSDLERASELFTQALSLAPLNDPRRGALLMNLGSSYQSLALRSGQPSDHNSAIECLSKAALFTHEESPVQALLLNSMITAHISRHRRVGAIEDINKAIEYSQRVLLLAFKGYTIHSSLISTIGNAYHARFEFLGQLSDLHEAIRYMSQAISTAPENCSDRPNWLSSLGHSYNRQFDQTGAVSDIDKAIEYMTQAVRFAPHNHAAKTGWLNNLGGALQARFQILGELSDIDSAIEYLVQSISPTPNEDSESFRPLSTLSLCLGNRFMRLGELGDINRALEYGAQSLELVSEDHISRPNILETLGNLHHVRSSRTGELSDVDQAIKYQAQALLLVPESRSGRPAFLNNLGNSYHHRFRLLQDASDIDDAICAQSQAVQLTLDTHVDKPSFLSNLGASYASRFLVGGDLKNIELAIDSYQKVIKLSTGHSFVRLNASRQWGRLAFLHKLSSPLEAYQHVMTLVPKVVWLGSSVDRRYERVRTAINDAAIEAAMVAIDLGQYELAIEWLETGRSIVWNQILRLRTPLDDLRTCNSSLADGLQWIAKELDMDESDLSLNAIPTLNTSTLENISQRKHSLAVEWDDLVEKARQLPGFQDFLKPRRAAELVLAAHSSTIVVINVHQLRCDALALTLGSTSPVYIALPLLSIEACIEMQKQRHQLLRSTIETGNIERSQRAPIFFHGAFEDEFETVLATLWTGVVKPILNALKYLQTPSSVELPRVTWCTNGPLAFLPLHAAGIYSEPHARTFHHVVSSYTPMISALIQLPRPPTQSVEILAIGQAATFGCTPLPGTVAELNRIKDRSGSIPFTRLDGENVTPRAVLSAMQLHRWVHLACHASQNTQDPSSSAFHLHGGQLSLSTITSKSLKNAELAFLSACQTAKGDENLPEEAVHLAAGMITAGYATVIATMWSINDEDAPIIATEFYSRMFDGSPDHRKAARALHSAVESLRAKVGERNFARWVPFIHIGQ